METQVLVIIIVILIAIIITISLIKFKRKGVSKDNLSFKYYKNGNRNTKNTYPCDASCKQICLQMCNQMYDNNPLCTQMCNYGLTDTISQKCTIDCVNQGGYGPDVCIPFCDDDCHKYCVTIGCGGANAVNSCGGLCY